MEPNDNELKENLSRLLSSLPDLHHDAKLLETRVNRMEQGFELNAGLLRSFHEREWPKMMHEMQSISEKLSAQLVSQTQQRAELDRIEQKLNLTTQAHEEKLRELKAGVEDSRTTLGRLTVAAAGSSALITGLIQVFHGLIKP